MASLPDRFDEEAFETYLIATGMSAANVKQVTKVTGRLLRGLGVQHPAKLDVFLQGQAVTPRDDLVALQAKANAWLPRGKGDPNRLDKSNGWALNHPLQKLINYKRERLLGQPEPLRRHKQPRIAAPTVPIDGLDSFGSALRQHYDDELRWNVFDEPVRVTALVARAGRYPIPPVGVQLARTLGLCKPLADWLRRGGGGSGRHVIDYLRLNSPTLVTKVREWLRDTNEGRKHLESCDTRADAFTVDHVNPQHDGGPHHLFNLHVMPFACNSYFKARTWRDPEKEAYVGGAQIDLVRRLMRDIGRHPLVADVSLHL